jgi:hypothetical protein
MTKTKEVNKVKEIEDVVEGEITEVANIEEKPAEIEVQEHKEIMIPLGSLSVSNPADIISTAVKTAKALADIVNKLNLYFTLERQGKITKYVYVDGWEVLGGMLGVGAHEESSTKLENGYEAIVVLKRHSDGAVVGRGSAICTRDENKWRNRDEYAIKSMAITRATGKAYRLSFSWIMKLAGYEATPAEEMEGERDQVEKEQGGKQPEGNNKSEPKKQENPKTEKINPQDLDMEDRIVYGKKQANLLKEPPADELKSKLMKFGTILGLTADGMDIKRALDRTKKSIDKMTFDESVNFIISLAREKEKIRLEGQIEDHA